MDFDKVSLNVCLPFRIVVTRLVELDRPIIEFCIPINEVLINVIFLTKQIINYRFDKKSYN